MQFASINDNNDRHKKNSPLLYSSQRSNGTKYDDHRERDFSFELYD